MSYILAPPTHKFPALSQLLAKLDPTPQKTILYVSTCAAVDYFQHLLPAILQDTGKLGFTVVPLHGKHPPAIRQKNFFRFSNATAPTILLTTDVAARGLDIPQVDLVVQLDPPSDPKVFLHRCGRAGRAGRRGLSVIFLEPGREEDYIPFLEVRKTPVAPLTYPQISVHDEDATVAIAAMRKVVLGDRALHDKAQRAFVSWVKAYSKHHASSIFRVADLSWTELGNAWSLLQLPRMPELKRWEGDRTLGLHMDFNAYAYKDKQREKLRKQALEVRETGVPDAMHEQSHRKKAVSRAWSQKLDKRDEREKRRDKKRTRREREQWEKMTPEEQGKQRELERMIEDVKRQKLEEDANENFEGFDN